MGLWRAFDQRVERAVLGDLARSERALLVLGLVLVVLGSLGLSWAYPGTAAVWLFIQLALLTFFLGLRWGAAWAGPTWMAYAFLHGPIFERLSFAAFVVYALLIAGVTVSKFRQARRGELALSSAMEMARQVQLSLQPPGLVDWSWACMATRIESARELGGDLVCWQQGPGSSLFVLVGDVMGKGAQAALTAAYVKGLFDEIAVTAPDPKEILTRLHRHLAQRTVVDSFLAAMAIQLDPEKNVWRVCRAGLPSALLVRQHGASESLSEGCIMLGLPIAPEFQLIEVAHRAGDQFFLASDGLCEEEELPAFITEILQSGEPTPLDRRLERCVNALLESNHTCAVDDRTAVLLQWL